MEAYLAVAKTGLISPGIPKQEQQTIIININSVSGKEEDTGTTTGGGSCWFTPVLYRNQSTVDSPKKGLMSKYKAGGR
jgi:hypothetical protein